MKIEIAEKQFNDIGRMWNLVHSDRGIIEAWFKHPDGRNLTQFYEDKTAFIRGTAYLNAEGFTCYAGIQPRSRDLLNGAASGGNQDITALRLLYLDIDPGSPADTNATDEEKMAALQVASRIQKTFKEKGYNKPILADSGNGAWLFFLIPDIEIHAGNWEEMNSRLKAWGQQIICEFSEEGVKIDPNVFDLRRITKVFGTRVANKAETEGRPQRISTFIDDRALIPDQKLRDTFLSLPVEISPGTGNRATPGAEMPFNLDRMFEHCYLMRFLKGKADSGTNLTHSVRLALSGYSLAFDDLNNELCFIRKMLQNCPDFSESKTRYYLQKNTGKGLPYGCDKLRKLVTDHFNDFELSRCNCDLPVSYDPETGEPRKPAPIRFAFFLPEDLDGVWEKLGKAEDPVKAFGAFQKFSQDYLSQVEQGTARAFLESKKEETGLKVGAINDLLKIRKVTKAGKPTQAEILCGLIGEGTEVFGDPDNVGFVSFNLNEHRETWPVRSKGFRRYLIHQFFEGQGRPPSNQGLLDALGQIESKAQFSGVKHETHIRTAFLGDRILIDLCNDNWEAVEITKNGFRVIQESPVKFRRARGMKALPYPEKGNLRDLRAFLNLQNESDWALLGGWLTGTLSGGPYPALMLQGEQGGGKSVFSRMMKRVIDPSSSPLRTVPRDIRDLMIAATNGWLIALDNLSGLPIWLSDALCRLSTGGGFSTRELYSDDEEILFNAMRPLILNGIEDIATRHDLVDRSILVELQSIPEHRRKPESVIWKAFERARPHILGGLYDAISSALRNIDSVDLPSLPRMADFAIWTVAAEKGSPWSDQHFMTAYAGNREEVVSMAVENDVVAAAVRDLVVSKDGEWTGTASELLDELNEIVSERTQKMKSWPKAAHILSGKLKRAMTFLKAVGIEVDFTKLQRVKRRVVREIRFRMLPQNSVTSVTQQGDRKPLQNSVTSVSLDRITAHATIVDVLEWSFS